MIWIGGRADKENYKVLSCSSDTRGEHWRLSAEVGQAVDSYDCDDHPGQERRVGRPRSPTSRRFRPGWSSAKRKKTPREREALLARQTASG
jgi:hypothetical protein